MIARALAAKLRKAAAQYPVVTLTGPRQSGKTTLAKATFPKYHYVSLEHPEQRAFALDDPNGFLRQFDRPVILDEVQRTPDLFSYVQTIVDETGESGRFILTGSQNFLLNERVSQSLAGRTAILHLLPFTQRELLKRKPLDPRHLVPSRARKPARLELWALLLTGFYPRIHDRNLEPNDWLANYYQTYLERDVRTLINVGDLEAFGRFVRLSAGRSGQLLNLVSLASDCGINHMTARRWLSVLEASFIVMQLQPHHQNFNRRLIKAPKLYFLDSGLLCFLLGIRKSEELCYHAMRGAIFESFVVAELYKAFANRGEIPPLFFWRDSNGNEVDLLLDLGDQLVPIEVKSGETLSSDSFKGVEHWLRLADRRAGAGVLLHGGSDSYVRKGIQALSWKEL